MESPTASEALAVAIGAGVPVLLWGSPAQAKGRLVDTRRHRVLKAPHPSPLSAHRGFIGCGHFSDANAWLREHGQSEIDWRLPPVETIDVG